MSVSDGALIRMAKAIQHLRAQVEAGKKLREECTGLIGQIELFAAREGEADFETGNAIEAARNYDAAIAKGE